MWGSIGVYIYIYIYIYYKRISTEAKRGSKVDKSNVGLGGGIELTHTKKNK